MITNLEYMKLKKKHIKQEMKNANLEKNKLNKTHDYNFKRIHNFFIHPTAHIEKMLPYGEMITLLLCWSIIRFSVCTWTS